MSATLILNIPGDNWDLHKKNIEVLVSDLVEEQTHYQIIGFSAIMIEGSVMVSCDPLTQKVHTIR